MQFIKRYKQFLYIYSKTNKLYCMCKDCFNKKEKCIYCNKEINKRFMKRHCQRQHSRRELEYSRRRELDSKSRPSIPHSQRSAESANDSNTYSKSSAFTQRLSELFEQRPKGSFPRSGNISNSMNRTLI